MRATYKVITSKSPTYLNYHTIPNWWTCAAKHKIKLLTTPGPSKRDCGFASRKILSLYSSAVTLKMNTNPLTQFMSQYTPSLSTPPLSVHPLSQKYLYTPSLRNICTPPLSEISVHPLSQYIPSLRNLSTSPLSEISVHPLSQKSMYTPSLRNLCTPPLSEISVHRLSHMCWYSKNLSAHTLT